MAAPSLSILDNFNRANGALGANWSGPTYQGDTALSIISNAAGGNSATFFDSNWSAATFGPDSEVYATLTAVPGTGDEAYMHARIQSPNTAGMDAYELSVVKGSGTDTISIRRVIDNSPTELATRSQEVAAGDRLGLVVLGTGATVTIQAWYSSGGGAWSQLGADVSDANAARITASGRIGIGTAEATARWDDFGGGTQVAGGVVGPLLEGRLVGAGILQGRLVR